MDYSLEYVLGLICGGLIGVVILLFFRKWTRRDHSNHCKYDERQQLVRGCGYKWGFFTFVMCDALYGIVCCLAEIKYVETQLAMFFIVLFGVAVYVGYCIWHEGYFALNEDRRRVMIAFALIAIFNFAIFGMDVMHGEVVKNGVLQGSCMNLGCGLLFVFIFLVVLAKMIQSRGEKE